MTAERREHRRTFFTKAPDRTIYLYVDGHRIEVGAVWDVSPFGVGLQIDRAINITHAISKDANVQLIYPFEGIDLYVHGLITWSMVFVDNQDSAGLHRSYRLGIALRQDDIEANVQFFKYVTGQLDEMPTLSHMHRA